MLVKEILDSLPYRRDEDAVARIISGDNEFELMIYLAKLKFERMGFSFGPSPRGSGWGRTGKKRA